MSHRILVCSDHTESAALYARALAVQGFQVDLVNINKAEQMAMKFRPELVLCLAMPSAKADLVCSARLVSELGQTVIFVDPVPSEKRALKALQLGVVAYLSARDPVNILVAQIRSVIRLRNDIAFFSRHRQVLGPMVIDHDQRCIRIDGSEVDLTKKEFDCLEVLARNPFRVTSYSHLIDILWGGRPASQHQLQMVVSRLRKKIETATGEVFVDSISRTGYRLAPNFTLPKNQMPRLSGALEGID